MKSGRIMIIDSDVEFLEELEHFFILEGWAVAALTSGHDADRRALSEKPDVILLELSEGPDGGGAAAEKLKDAAGTSGIPVIYLTGYYSVLNENPDERICLKRHFNPERVVEEVKRILDEL